MPHTRSHVSLGLRRIISGTANVPSSWSNPPPCTPPPIYSLFLKTYIEAVPWLSLPL